MATVESNKAPMSKQERKLSAKIEKLKKGKRGITRVWVATGSINKFTGISEHYEQNGLDTISVQLEKETEWTEPQYEALETAEAKVAAALIFFGFATIDDFEDGSLGKINNLADSEKFKLKDKKKNGLVDAMDVTTTLYSIATGISEKKELYKIARNDKNFPEAPDHIRRSIVEDDKVKMKPLFLLPFEVVFECSRSIASTRGNFANSVNVRYKVKYFGLPEKHIDDAYNSDSIYDDGSRVGLAQLIKSHPELIESITVVDLNSEEQEEKELSRAKYHMVPDFVQFGKVDAKTHRHLLKERKTEVWRRKFSKVRANV